MKKEYEIVGKNKDGDWETIDNSSKSLKGAMSKCKKINKEKWIDIDINLIIDNSLEETYDINGNIR